MVAVPVDAETQRAFERQRVSQAQRCGVEESLRAFHCGIGLGAHQHLYSPMVGE